MLPVLSVESLNVTFASGQSTIHAVADVAFELRAGEVLAVVGESGSGKSQMALAILGLLAPNARRSGRATMNAQDLFAMSERELETVRGRDVAMVFQDPMTALNPYLSIATQMTEVLRLHRGMEEKVAYEGAVEMLERVRIPQARERMHRYPHEFSGGMRQRIMIAMALLCEPRVLIADEPTTALDVTVQAQILDLLDDLRRDLGTAVILITHDMGVVARLADRVAVMYKGRIVETGSAHAVLLDPRHPYTVGLLASSPQLLAPIHDVMPMIKGMPPAPGDNIEGCAFAPRCPRAFDRCSILPALDAVEQTRAVACHLYDADLRQ